MMEVLALVEVIHVMLAGAAIVALAVTPSFQVSRKSAPAHVRFFVLATGVSALHVGFQAVARFFE